MHRTGRHGKLWELKFILICRLLLVHATVEAAGYPRSPSDAESAFGDGDVSLLDAPRHLHRYVRWINLSAYIGTGGIFLSFPFSLT